MGFVVSAQPNGDELVCNLFEQLFSLRHARLPQHWELVLGLALLSGELAVSRPPQAPELARIHHVAADVALALNISVDGRK
jgi:hypothetical protein